MKYTKEILAEVVSKSYSVQDVMRKLGLNLAGGTHCHLTRRIKQFNLDTSHFLPFGKANAGTVHHGGSDKLHFSTILVRDRLHGRKEPTIKLRRAMLESGIPHRCADYRCPLHKRPEWIDRPIVLQIDHIDGDWLNNERDNVRFLCPNCHAQTPNFGAKNIGRLTELAIDNLYAWTGGDEY